MTIKEQLASNIVGHWNFRTGSIADQSGNGNDGTFVGTPIWGNSPRGREIVSDGSTTAISLGDILDNVFAGEDAKFSITSVATPLAVASNVLVAKIFTGGQRQFGFRILTGKTNFFWYGDLTGATPIRSVIGSVAIDSYKEVHITMTYDGSIDTNNGLDRVQFYINGVRDTGTTLTASGGALSYIQDGPAPLGIASALTTANAITSGAGGVFKGGMKETIVWDDVLTNQQASQLYVDWQKEAHLNKIPTKTFLPEQVSDAPTISSPVLAYDMCVRGGMIYDTSGNGKNSTSIKGVGDIEGLFGRASYFRGEAGDVADIGRDTIGNALNGASGSSVSYWLNLVGFGAGGPGRNVVSCWSGAHYGAIVSTVEPSGTGYTLITRGRSQTADTLQANTGTTVVPLGTWVHVVSVMDYANGTMSTFLNGELYKTSAATFGSTTYVHSSANADDSIGGYVTTHNIIGAVDNMTFYDTALDVNGAAALYEKGRNKLSFYCTGEDWNVTPSAQSSGYLSNTPLKILSGSHNVVVTENNKKGVECATDGFLSVPIDSFFGELKFKAYNAISGGTIGMYISDGELTGAWNGYGAVITGGSDEAVISKVTSGAGSVLGTGSAISVGQTHVIKLTRKSSGAMKLFIDDEEEVSVTNTAYSSGARFLFFNLDAGDIISEVRFSPVIFDPTA